MIRPGPKNSISDIPGIQVGNVDSLVWRSGVTSIVPEKPVVAAVDVRGGGPGTRETDALNADCLVDKIHAIVLSGGSAFGLAAADGVMCHLAQKKIGFQLGDAIIPVVPAAILFDLLNGGDKNWRQRPPYFDMGYQSVEQLQDTFEQGNVGAGMGAIAGALKGGLGSASFIYQQGTEEVSVGALAAVNSVGSVLLPDSPVMWAAPYEQKNELGGQAKLDLDYKMKLDFTFPDLEGANTTLVVVATNISLSRAQAKRIAIMAQDGLARAIRPVHSPFDGDTVFVLSTEGKILSNPATNLAKLGMLAADCVTRAVARGVFEAETLGDWESYQSRYGPFLNKLNRGEFE